MDTKITLICLVQGESSEHAFSVHTQMNTLIGDLKKLIKVEKPNDFRDMDADKLKLWKVNIPEDDDDALKNLTLEDKAKGILGLRPTWKILKAFPEE